MHSQTRYTVLRCEDAWGRFVLRSDGMAHPLTSWRRASSQSATDLPPKLAHQRQQQRHYVPRLVSLVPNRVGTPSRLVSVQGLQGPQGRALHPFAWKAC